MLDSLYVEVDSRRRHAGSQTAGRLESNVPGGTPNSTLDAHIPMRTEIHESKNWWDKHFRECVWNFNRIHHEEKLCRWNGGTRSWGAVDFGVEECGELSGMALRANRFTACCHHHRYLALYALRRQQIDIGRAMHIVRVSVKDRLVEFIYQTLIFSPRCCFSSCKTGYLRWVIHAVIQYNNQQQQNEQHTYHKKGNLKQKKIINSDQEPCSLRTGKFAKSLNAKITLRKLSELIELRSEITTTTTTLSVTTLFGITPSFGGAAEQP